MYGRGHSECEDFAKSARRDDALLSFCSSINLTSREKVSVHWGNQEKIHSQNLLGGKLPPPPPTG